MKIALCVSGQMRTFDNPGIISLNKKLVNKLSCDVFISTWSNRGVSLWSQVGRPDMIDLQNAFLVDSITEEKIMKSFDNVRAIEIENYDDFNNKIGNIDIKDLLNNDFNSRYNNKISSYPELYKIYKANRLKQAYEDSGNFKYDVVIRTRPDIAHINTDIDVHFHDLADSVYHMNTDSTFFPLPRIYSLFFFGNSKTMDIISDSYNAFLELVAMDSCHHLPAFDSPRLLYNQCIKNGICIKTIHRTVGDVFRIEEDFNEYVLRFKYT